MRRSQRRIAGALTLALAAGLGALAGPARSQMMPVGEHPLSALVTVDERLAPTSPDVAPVEEVQSTLSAKVKGAWSTFLGGPEGEWGLYIDRRSGLLESAEGPGIPWIPGRGNQLAASDVPALADKARTDLGAMEKVARGFLPRVADLLGVDPASLVLDRGRSGQPADYLWFVDFNVVLGGLPVDGARVVFRVNHGNLVQFGAENLPAPGARAPRAKVSRAAALAVLAAHVGGFQKRDRFTDRGSLHLLPVAVPDARFAEGFRPGAGRGLLLAWQFDFGRRGASWRGRVDATTGKLLDFVSLDEYAKAQVTGGVMVGNTQTHLPMPWADLRVGTTLQSYANSAGVYDWTSGTLTCNLNGQYIRILDQCGLITGTTDAIGNLDFGNSAASNCSSPGFGNGNTRSSRTQFYNLNRIKEKGRGWLPTNTWLNAQLTANVNINSACNAYWSPTFGTVNFYRSGIVQTFNCNNTGEIAGVALHEYGHGLDTNDGNGTSLDKGTGEVYGDITAALQTHDSCIGTGFFNSPPNCFGYGDTCLSCNGVRDIDWNKHVSHTAHTVANFIQPTCPFPSPQNPTYTGPCGKEGHCESYVASEALWDLAARDLPSPGTSAAWSIVDRLWYLSRSTANRAFVCTTTTNPWTSNGCTTGAYWRAMRAIDDDDGNLTNGTPHSCSLYAAFNRHGIACPGDQGANVCFSACTPPATPALTLTPGDNQMQLSWTSSGAGIVYDVYRNEAGCNAGFTRINSTPVTGTTYTDTQVANDFTYSYQVIAYPSGSLACAGPPSGCQSATPRKKTDVWSQDLPQDTGLEPDPATAGLPMWMSDDIWVRNDTQAGPHQNPEAGQLNYIHVTVRNRSNVRAYDTPVKVYFANASTGLSWPIHWTQIGNPQIIPTLDPNQTAEIVVQWTPTQTGHFCLLSRLDTPQDPMTFAETTDIEYNVRYNNNIVWKNVNVVDLVPNPIVPVSFIFRAVRRAPPPAGFSAGTEATAGDLTRLTFREPRLQAATNPFLKRARVLVVFPEKLRALMDEQGIEPRGFEQVDDKTFSVAEPEGAYIELYLNAGDEFAIDMTFEDAVKHTNESDKVPVRYGFDVVQEQEKQVVGGVSYNIQAIPVD